MSILPTFAFISSGPVTGMSVGLGLGWRWYPWKRAPAGFFLGPVGEAAYFSIKEEDTGAKASELGTAAGAILGYQWIFDRKITLILAGGAAYLMPSEIEVGESHFQYPPVMPRLFLEVGYTFGRVAGKKR